MMTGNSQVPMPRFFLHAIAAALCFGVLAGLPIAACLTAMIVTGDAGGPMFLFMFALGVILLAAFVTVLFAATALAAEYLHRRLRLPLWIPPLFVFMTGTCVVRYLMEGARPVLAAGIGAGGALAFVAYWAAASSFWFLPRTILHVWGGSAREEGDGDRRSGI